MGPIWDPSGQPAYGLTHMGPMPNPAALPIWVPYGQPIWDPYRHVCWVIGQTDPYYKTGDATKGGSGCKI